MPVGSVEPELAAQLEALAAQTFDRPWELVISLNTPDPAARRSIESALADFADRAGDGPSTSIVDSSSVRSAAHARNTGAAAASAPLLAFCDSDDIADPAWLAAIADGLADHAVVGGFLEEARLAVAGQENWRPPATPGDNPQFMGHPYLVSANMGIRADVFAASGGFDESLLRGEDIAFAWALIRRGHELGFVPEAIMHYRHRKGLWLMMKQHYLYGRGMTQVLARHGVPDGSDAQLFRANGQHVDRMNGVHVLRRGSIAVGRVVGIALERLHPGSVSANVSLASEKG
jgi:glycosyltransferase involved in cell wall biosynthesis